LHSEQASDHQLLTVDNSTKSVSHEHDEPANAKSLIFDSSYEHEVITVDDVVISVELDQNDDTCAAEVDEAELSSREILGMATHNELEECSSDMATRDELEDAELFAAAAVTMSDEETADAEIETTLSSSVEKNTSASDDVCSSGEVIVFVVDSEADMNVSLTELHTTITSTHSPASDEQAHDGDKVDDNTAYHAVEDIVRWSVQQPTDQLCFCQAQADSAHLPCVPSTVSKSELASTVESSSGLSDHYEEEVEVCCVCCIE